MTFNGRTLLERSRKRLARAVTFVLLSGIVYSVSFGTVHKHRDARQTSETSTIASSAGTAATSQVLPVSSGTQTDNCLICVLQQQLFSSTVDTPNLIVTPAPEATIAAAALVFYHSTPIVSSPIARLSGRAPPSRLG